MRRIIDFLFNPDGEPRPTDPGKDIAQSPEASRGATNSAPASPISDEWAAKDVNVVSCNGPAEPDDRLTSRCGISLRPWDDRFEDVVCGWRNDLRFVHLWNASRRLSIREEFWADINQMLEHTTFFLVHLKGQEDPIGCIYANRPSCRVQKFLQLNVILSEESRKMGYGMAATYLFLRYLFEQFDISKVVLEIYGWNAHTIRTASHQSRLEGIRRNHVYWNGRAYDQYEFGVTREAFYGEVVKSSAWKRLVGENLPGS